jgi:hypothetical protein
LRPKIGPAREKRRRGGGRGKHERGRRRKGGRIHKKEKKENRRKKKKKRKASLDFIVTCKAILIELFPKMLFCGVPFEPLADLSQAEKRQRREEGG